MRERIMGIPQKLAEFWNKYTSKQKTIIIAVICAILVAIGVLAYFLSRPTWSKFQVFDNIDDSNAMAKALDGAEIEYKTSDDSLTLYVKEGDMTKALYAMSDNNLTDKGYTWDKAFDNSMATTESEKSQKRILALQSEIKKSLIEYSFIDDADVFIDVPETSYKVLDDGESTATSVTARVSIAEKNKDKIKTDTAEALAYWLANAVGTDVKHVIINDSDGNSVYNGSLGDGLGGTLTGGASEYCDKLRNTIAANVTDLLLKCNYDDIQVGTQGIQFDMSKIERLTKTYSVAEGREYGYPTNLYTYASKGGSGTVGGEPGTASNDDDTDTVINTGTSTTSSVDTQKLENLLTDETIENIKIEKPTIQYNDSSLGIVATRYIVYEEEKLETDGTLDNQTFEEFVAANSQPVIVQASEEELQLISTATGINTANISVMAYEVPKFVEKTEVTRTISDYLMIILAVLIIALLIFVVVRGTAPVKDVDEEPELSVEQLLATTKENQSLEDIEFSEKSETRKMIEKFVDENPEAVATLLRNWLNDDWD
ncbi:MAG: hypothetical protein II374_01385 [Lachnospiraceae bacterium]|nr:hypothetical protein [Lachnospiraceae bacterium]